MTFPPRQVRRWEPPAPSRRPIKKKVPARRIPFLWWQRHPWIVLWVLVFSTPAVMLTLRIIDDTSADVLVTPALVLVTLVFLAALGVAVVVGARRSPGRALAGVAGAVLCAALLLLPMIHVIGARSCPVSMGDDRGSVVSASILEAWKTGDVPDEKFDSPVAAASWRERAGRLALLEYQLVDSGCWERMSPVATSRTWHEFRVTVRQGDEAPLSKVLTVHTLNGAGGWKIAEVEGPLP